MPTKYELVEGPDSFWALQLSEGKYAGIIYRYGSVKFVGEDDEGNGRISFEYDILDPSDFNREDLVGEELSTIMGEILHDIIVESLENRKEDNGNNSENYSEDVSTE